MTNFFSRLPRLQFSLGALFAVLTLAAVGFGAWWLMPWQVNHLPQELSVHRPGLSPFGRWGCGTTGEDLSAVWTEQLAFEMFSDSAKYYQREKKPVHAKSGKCWVRRDWHKPWVLDGQVEVFDAAGQRIIRAHYRNGQLHGEFYCWFTDGKVRETGSYWHGKMDGVWEEFEFSTGKVNTHAEYERGEKCGTWKISGIQEFYKKGKIVRQIWPGEKASRVSEFDEQEKLKQETYWWKEPKERYGIDRYRSDEYSSRVRHGDWERICPFDGNSPAAVTFTQRGSWKDNLASGEWIFERPASKPRRLQFQKGKLLTIDGQPAFDLVMRKYETRGEYSDLSVRFTMPDTFKFQNQSRADALREVLNYSVVLHLDPRLGWSEEKQQQFFAEKLPSDFYFAQLPHSAALCLLVHDSRLTFDFRHHAIWLTSPELAVEWKDETNTAPWFEVIVNARPTRYDPPKVVRSLFANEPDKTYTLEDDGMNPNMMRSELFPSEWKEAWQKREIVEFRKPLQCAQGIAYQIDPNFDRSRKAVELLDPESEEYFRNRELDQQVAYECEVYQCRLKLQGDTLVFEPRAARVEAYRVDGQD